ncbi:heme ABC exporter ATP-binding protein CcmA [Maritimibacter fusiformis]|uniref:Heme ABC exporter ATP-binding protein CcmA n=1 Tax=Maritimibacter fusiformis TaxID=2603819 RepID=A0A5D0RK70_9RHOB|nr:heme ABC exporter ATP-binding protein CcmA [Maritimibacter fusiformis]TYB81306.1 heme ABC exporter ATP-binding protein CcmA [Maritimibacter fusiformis]
MSDLTLRQIKKSFGRTEVLHGIDLDIQSGEFVSLLGASGCGKTTLLRIIAGLERVSGGTVSIAGKDVTSLPPEKRDIAMMFQSYALLPHLTVAENVRFPLRMRGQGSREEQAERVVKALDTVQLAHLADRRIRQLSGGQQQRVALARAIVSSPQVLLLDEPLSNLDARLREEMQVELMEIHNKLGLTTIFVTHDQEEALSLSDRVVLLNDGQIEQQGSPRAIYSAPETGFASFFLGAANLLPVTVEDGPVARFADDQVLALPETQTERGERMLLLRQEDLKIVPADTDGALKARVAIRVFLGARHRYMLDLAGQRISLNAPNSVLVEPGDEVGLTIDPEQLRVLAR